MSGPPTEVGLVGVGRWGALILRDLRSLGCSVSAVARSADSRARAVDGGASAVVDTIADLPEMDAYVVAAPTSQHGAVVAELLDRGRPVFCEKPLATSLAEMDALPAEAAERLVFCMDKWRYHAGVRLLARSAADGRYGSVQGLSLVRVGGVSPSNPLSVLWHLVPHDLAICLEVFGSVPEPRWCAQPVTDGCRHAVHAALGDDPWVTVLASERRAQHFREVRMTCDEAEVVLPGGYADALVVRRHNRSSLGDPEMVPFENSMPLLAELDAFIGHVRGEVGPPKSGFVDARRIVATLERLDELAGVAPTS